MYALCSVSIVHSDTAASAATIVQFKLCRRCHHVLGIEYQRETTKGQPAQATPVAIASDYTPSLSPTSPTDPFVRTHLPMRAKSPSANSKFPEMRVSSLPSVAMKFSQFSGSERIFANGSGTAPHLLRHWGCSALAQLQKGSVPSDLRLAHPTSSVGAVSQYYTP